MIYKNEIRDKQIIQKYIDSSANKIKSGFQYWSNIDLADKQYLDKRFKDIHIASSKPSEFFIRLLKDLEETPLCPVCGSPTKFGRFSLGGYQKYCSNACKHSDLGKQLVAEQVKETCQDRYKGNSPMSNDSIKNLALTKSKQTLQDRYNVDHNWKIPEVREQIKDNVKEKTGYEYAFLDRNKVETTSLQNWGVPFVLQAEPVKEKIKETKLIHYGYDHQMKNPEYSKVFHENLKYNNKSTSSKPEDFLFQLLSQNFNMVKRNYSSNEYPFKCDFYVEDRNLYIELQAYYKHGFHPYSNENDPLLKFWKDKIKTNKSKEEYENAIYVWTIRDVLKRNTALKNNLNYIEIFTSDFEKLKFIVNDIKENNIKRFIYLDKDI